MYLNNIVTLSTAEVPLLSIADPSIRKMLRRQILEFYIRDLRNAKIQGNDIKLQALGAQLCLKNYLSAITTEMSSLYIFFFPYVTAEGLPELCLDEILADPAFTDVYNKYILNEQTSAHAE